MMTSRKLLPYVASAALVLAGAALTNVHAAPIDLRDFFADPTVTVASDGAAALLEEDPGFGLVLLANDPGLGDPEVLVPAAGTVLRFDYVFDEGAGNDDEFGVFIVDAATGFSVDAPYEFFIQQDAAGSVEWSLGPLLGMSIGLQFQLASMPGDAASTSTLTISDVVQVTAIPLPPAAALLLPAVWTLAVMRRRGDKGSIQRRPADRGDSGMGMRLHGI